VSSALFGSGFLRGFGSCGTACTGPEASVGLADSLGRYSAARRVGRDVLDLPPASSPGSVRGVAIAQFPGLVIDCPDASALAHLNAALLDWSVHEVADDSGSWAEAHSHDDQVISFQQVTDYHPPEWPGQDVPQQMHLDVVVDDLDAAEAASLQLGATRHAEQPGTTFRVMLDPAGHPFCLCLS
jgi:Glyoxalase-like domain